MNERTIQLITEADAYAWTISEKYVPECGEISYLWEDAFRKKFAELIVKECAGICDRQGRAGWNDDRKAQARLDRDLIKQHFGVEE